MKTSKILTALAMLGMVACNNVSDDVISHGSALSIKVGTQTKALVTETTLPDAAQIGTFLHNSEGALYDALPYGNVKFTASGAGALQTWAPETDVMLSATQGTLYGYYPYSASATDLSAVAVEAASQTDYMWATPVSGLDNKNSSATLTMNHALTAVRLKVVRGDYAGAGLVTAASVQSNALATAATMNIADGALASVTGAGEVIAPALSQFTLSASEQAVEFIAVPVDGASEALTIEMVVDGQTLVVEASATDYPQAAIAEYGVTVNGTGLALTQVTVTPWTETSKGNLGISEVKPAPEPATVKIKHVDGTLYTDDEWTAALTASTVTNEQAVGVAIPDPRNEYAYLCVVHPTAERVDKKWSSNTTVLVDGVFTPKGYDSAAREDIAETDYAGQANTDAILAAVAAGTIEDAPAAQYCAGITFADGKTGYLPAAGEILQMANCETDINACLAACGGTRLYFIASENYWSSTQSSADCAWMWYYNLDLVIDTKDRTLRVRAVSAF